jgi:hypothetical protein
LVGSIHLIHLYKIIILRKAPIRRGGARTTYARYVEWLYPARHGAGLPSRRCGAWVHVHRGKVRRHGRDRRRHAAGTLATGASYRSREYRRPWLGPLGRRCARTPRRILRTVELKALRGDRCRCPCEPRCAPQREHEVAHGARVGGEGRYLAAYGYFYPKSSSGMCSAKYDLR